jgi:DNA-directed RNA polymerase specialized sigma24 family protein
MQKTFDHSLAFAVVRALVTRKAKLFAAFPDIGLDDLEQEAMLAVHKGWPKYDASKSSASTFIYMLAARRLLSIARDLRRRLRRDQILFARTIASVKPFDPVADFEPDNLVDWLGGVYRTVRRNMHVYGITTTGKHAVGDHPKIDGVQAAALLALQRKLGASGGQIEQMLRDRPALAAAVAMVQVPKTGFLDDATVNVLRATRRASSREGM